MRYEYAECVSDSCDICGLETDKYENIGFWKNESAVKHDKSFCLNCVLENNIQAPHIDELLFEGVPQIHNVEDAVNITVESVVGLTLHSFRVDRRTEVWTDPGPEITSAGPSKSSREYNVTEMKSKESTVEVIQPKSESTQYKSDYWLNYVKRYVDI